jgi:hypothetical protein
LRPKGEGGVERRIIMGMFRWIWVAFDREFYRRGRGRLR